MNNDLFFFKSEIEEEVNLHRKQYNNSDVTKITPVEKAFLPGTPVKLVVIRLGEYRMIPGVVVNYDTTQPIHELCVAIKIDSIGDIYTKMSLTDTNSVIYDNEDNHKFNLVKLSLENN